MPFDSKGNFTRLHNWEDDRINGIEIVTDHMDEEDNNFADGLSQCFLKNGLSTMQNDFDAGNFKVRNVSNGVNSKDAVNKSQLEALQTTLQAYADAIIPKGTIFPYGGTTAPSGFLMCDGSAVSRTTYAGLFAVIGTKYGSGNGSTTFNLPNGKIPLGISAPVNIGANSLYGLTGNEDKGIISVTQGSSGVGDTFSRILAGGSRIALSGMYIKANQAQADLTRASAVSNAIIKY